MDFRDANAGAEIDWFHKHREPQLSFDVVPDAGRVGPPLCATPHQVADLGQVAGGKQEPS